MKEISSKKGPIERPRLSLEQKLLLIVHRYRAAEKRRKQKEAARSKRLRMIALFIVTAILLPSLAILFGRASASEAQVAFNHADRALASGHYAKAARECEQLFAQRGYSTPLLFNLGEPRPTKRLA